MTAKEAMEFIEQVLGNLQVKAGNREFIEKMYDALDVLRKAVDPGGVEEKNDGD